MKIYVDFDDCLCETGRYLSSLAERLFGKHVPYEDMRFFELQKSFSLSEEQFEYLMAEGHKPEALLSIEETPGASAALQAWLNRGCEVFVITGRPYSAYEPSRVWLDQHGLENVPLFCFNKYGRDAFYQNSGFSLEPDDYYRMHFDLAVEDSPQAFRFFTHLPRLKVMVFDRPWNREAVFPGSNYFRCRSWDEIRSLSV